MAPGLSCAFPQLLGAAGVNSLSLALGGRVLPHWAVEGPTTGGNFAQVIPAPELPVGAFGAPVS